MIISGWINFLITGLLVTALFSVIFHYYRPGRKEIAARAEEPKFRMLNDDDV